MRFCVLLLLFFLFATGRCQAQDQNRPFLKVSHVGSEQKPLYGTFISPRRSALDEKLELMPGYRAEPVFLVSKGEFDALLKFARRYAAQVRNMPENTTFGTCQLTFSDGRGSDISIVTAPADSLHLVTELLMLVDGFGPANRRAPALREALQTLALRLSN